MQRLSGDCGQVGSVLYERRGQRDVIAENVLSTRGPAHHNRQLVLRPPGWARRIAADLTLEAPVRAAATEVTLGRENRSQRRLVSSCGDVQRPAPSRSRVPRTAHSVSASAHEEKWRSS
jgi:hypothetical protein